MLQANREKISSILLKMILFKSQTYLYKRIYVYILNSTTKSKAKPGKGRRPV